MKNKDKVMFIADIVFAAMTVIGSIGSMGSIATGYKKDKLNKLKQNPVDNQPKQG